MKTQKKSDEEYVFEKSKNHLHKNNPHLFYLRWGFYFVFITSYLSTTCETNKT